MYRDRTDGIVNSQPFQQVDSQDDEDSRDSAKKDRSRRADPIARASDRNESCQKPVSSKACVPLLGHKVTVNNGGQSRRACREGCICGHASDASEVHRGKGATGIETIPAEPENESAGDSDCQIVRQHWRAAVSFEFAAEPRTQNDRAGQRNESADRVYDRGACEVVESDT